MSPSRKLDPVVSQLLAMVDEAYDARSWHGTNLRGSLRGLKSAQAAWRPGRSRHNVWEIVLHAAYWKYAVWRRLSGEKRGSFALKGSNWFKSPQGKPSDEEWRGALKMLAAEHARLREAIVGVSPRSLKRRPRGSRYTLEATIRGVAAHDLYHAGQVQLLKRLHGR
jgi:uncharacterized damage-inducible protein DinB